MRSLARTLRTAPAAIALCALTLTCNAPTSTADMLDPQLKVNYEFTIHEKDTVDVVETITAAGLSGEDFAQFCKKENFPTIESAVPTAVEQIDQDGEPACKISATDLSPDDTSMVVWSLSHDDEDGSFTFSASPNGDFKDATMTVNFPGKATQADSGGKTDGNSAIWTALGSDATVTATGDDSPSQPLAWFIGAGVAAVIGIGIVLAVVLRARKKKRSGLTPKSAEPEQQPHSSHNQN